VSQPQPTLSQYLDVLRRQAWVIVAVAAVAAATAGIVSVSRESVYRASMQVVVGQGGGVFEAQFGSAVEPFTQTMTNLLKSNVVAERVVDNLNLDTTPEQLLKHVHVSTRPQSSVLVVDYDAPLSDQPERVVRELGTVFTALVDEKLGASRAGAGSGSLPVITATVFDPSHLEADRVSPRPARSLAFAGLIGLALGLILGVARDSTDVRIRGKADAEEWFGAPVTGTLPKGLRGKPPFGLLGGPIPRDPAFANALQLLRANLEFSSLKGPTIVVTSALPEEGKSTVAANLSVALASAGNDVICVECDVRKPRIHEYLGLNQTEGFVDVLEQRTKLDQALISVPLRSTASRTGVAQGRLRVLLSGTRPTEPLLTQLFASDRIDDLLEALGKSAKYVIFDTPPVLLVGDAFPLLAKADSILVVAREGRTRKESAQAVRATLQALGTESVSVILTDARATSGYGYGYGYGYGEGRLTTV
jgi:non-specific protein-tyrosine kinase